MKYGVFDHMDLGGGSLAEQYDSRLRLVEAYDRAGFRAGCALAHWSTFSHCRTRCAPMRRSACLTR
jgi:hypothetical protein